MAYEPSCFYCKPTPQRDEVMVEIAALGVSTLFLFREQTHPGRCLVAYRDHTKEVCDLSEGERNAFFADVARAAKALSLVCRPDKINYGAYADKNPHLHFHLVPKYVDGPSWGSTFEMNPGKVYLNAGDEAALVAKFRAALT
jgi:diadenosine tetraphosphate (Ap4A) HIT family hydrolase